MHRLFCGFALLLARAVQAKDYAGRLVPLIQQSKLATLRTRGANPRIQKCVYWLDEARKAGYPADKVAEEAVTLAGYTNKAASDLTKAALLRNLDIAEKLGCLDETGRAAMRHGNTAIVRKGPY